MMHLTAGGKTNRIVMKYTKKKYNNNNNNKLINLIDSNVNVSIFNTNLMPNDSVWVKDKFLCGSYI